MIGRNFVICLVLLPGCSDNQEKDLSEIAVERASIYCHASSEQLTWLTLLIKESESNPSLAGPIYIFQSNGQTVFMHQPWIMSCLGCILYDCQGNRLEPDDIDPSVLADGFQDLTVLYNPPL